MSSFTDVPWVGQSLNNSQKGFRVLLVLFFASVVEFLAAAFECGDTNCERERAWAVVVGAVSTVFSMIFLCCPISKAGFVSVLLAVWWIAGAAVMTFDAPFILTGNGYFGTWIATIASCLWAYIVYITNYGNQTHPRPTPAGGQVARV